MVRERAAQVLDLAGAIGRGLLESACSAADTVETVRQVCRSGGLEHVAAHVSHTKLTLSWRPPGQEPMARVETIGPRSFDYGRQTRFRNLAQRVTDGRLDLDAAQLAATEAEGARGAYPGWTIYPLAGSAGASAAILFGGDWRAALAAFAANVLLAWVMPALGSRGWPAFYLQIIAGFVGQLAALALRLIDPGINASVVVIAVILIMFAGMTTTGAVKDAITGWELTAAGRLMEAVVNTAGLVVGIRGGLLVSERLGVDMAIVADVARADFPLWGLMLASAFVGGAFSMVAQSPPRVIAPTATLAALSWLIFAAATGPLGLPAAWASGLSAVAAGAIGVLLARWLRACVDGFAVAAVVPLMPGILIYQGLWKLGGDLSGATESLVAAAATALALAVGLTFGEYLGAGAAHRLSRAVDHLVPVFARRRQGV